MKNMASNTWCRFAVAVTIIISTATSIPIRSHGSGLYSKKQLAHKNMFDGDMLIGRRKKKLDRKRRLALEDKQYDWLNATIPYTFDEVAPIGDVLYNITMASFEHISNHTCVRFIPWTNEEDYVNITAADSGCYSQVGVFGGMQPLNLASDCDALEVVVHELLHALGFLHEHNRLDRDNYVYVNFTNVKSLGQSSYQKYDPGQFGAYTLQDIPYDKQSVLHYHRYAFSQYDAQTHLGKKEHMAIYSLSDYQEILGNQLGLSNADVMRVNARYCGANVTVSQNPTTTATATTTEEENPTASGATTQDTNTSITQPTATTPATEPANVTSSQATTERAILTTSQETNTGSTQPTLTTIYIGPTTNNTFNNSLLNFTWGVPGSAHSHFTSVYTTLLLATLATIMIAMIH